MQGIGAFSVYRRGGVRERLRMADYLTGEQAAALLGVARRTLYRWMEAGKLSAEEWTVERLQARRDELLNPQRVRPAPHCPRCDTRTPSRFSPHANRPSGYDGYCRACNAERMRQARMNRGASS